jgi:hypothetical protein
MRPCKSAPATVLPGRLLSMTSPNPPSEQIRLLCSVVTHSNTSRPQQQEIAPYPLSVSKGLPGRHHSGQRGLLLTFPFTRIHVSGQEKFYFWGEGGMKGLAQQVLVPRATDSPRDSEKSRRPVTTRIGEMKAESGVKVVLPRPADLRQSVAVRGRMGGPGPEIPS